MPPVRVLVALCVSSIVAAVLAVEKVCQPPAPGQQIRDCRLCEHTAAPTLMPYITYTASSSCNADEGGQLLLPGPVTMPESSTLTSPTSKLVSIVGDIVVNGKDVTIKDVVIYGSINVTKGEGLKINNVRLVADASKTHEIPAVRAYNAALDGATFVNVSVVGGLQNPSVPIALLACSGLVTVTCASATDRVMVQQAKKLTVDLQSPCEDKVINLDVLVASFGRVYETEYLHDFMGQKPSAKSTLRTVVFYTGYLTAALGIYTLASGGVAPKGGDGAETKLKTN